MDMASCCTSDSNCSQRILELHEGNIILMESFSRREGYTRKELSAEEYKRLKSSFDALDPEETGSIEAEDLVSLMRCTV